MTIGDRLDDICDRIDRAARRFGHQRSDIDLIAVSKYVDRPAIEEALAYGIQDFGENQVQEIVRKKAWFAPARLHMIGQLQSNKVRKLPHDLALIQSIDRPSLVRELEKVGAREGVIFHGLIQVNNAGEAQKGGIAPHDLPALLDLIEGMEHLQIEGLMNIAPFFEQAEGVRPYFRDMRKLFEKIKNLGYNRINMKHLSMGMTHDYELALEEGANMVRIGRAIFGERASK